jgi:AraC-like DNA-binding protein
MHEETQNLLALLRHQLIPWWERDGLARLVVSAPTQREFLQQPLPPGMKISPRKRRGRKVARRGERIFGNRSLRVEVFPEDAQEVCRHPMLYCVLKGQADLDVADYIVHCPAGYFILMRPGVPQPDGSRSHLEPGNSQNYCEILNLSLLPGSACIAAWICTSQGERHSYHSYYLLHQHDMVQLLHFGLSELLNRPSSYRETATNSLHSFFLLFQRELQEKHLKPEYFPVTPVAHRFASGDSDPMDFALDYLDKHLHLPLTSTGMAEVMFMSRSSFLRAFSRATGQSFNRYLTERRVEKACELLEAGLSVLGASHAIGITPTQLNRIFKAHLGCSPSEFKRHLKDETI